MLVVCLPTKYNISWIQKQFNRRLCLFRFENFPTNILKNDWIGININKKIVFIGQFQESIPIINTKMFRIYLINLIGFNPISYNIPNKNKYKYIKISVKYINGRNIITVGTDKRIVPVIPKIYKSKH